MGNWIINDNNNIYICDEVALNKIKMPKDSKEKFVKLFKLDHNDICEITEELAEGLLNKSAKKNIGIKNEEKISYNRYVLNSKSMVITNEYLEHMNEIKILKKDIEVDPFVELYEKAIAKNKLISDENRNILIDLESRDIVRRIWLLKDYALEEVSLQEELFQNSENSLKKLDAISIWQNKSIYDFSSVKTDLVQIPYKISVSNNGTYYAGVDGIIQDLRASYKNIDLKLKEVYSNYNWITADNWEVLLENSIELLFNRFEPEELEKKIIFFNKEKNQVIIHKMIDKFESLKDSLRVEVKQHKTLSVYSMRARLGDESCTQWLYGYDPQKLYVRVLEHFYAVQHQNCISFDREKDNGYSEETALELLPIGDVKLLKDKLGEKYKLQILKVDELLKEDIHVLRLEER
ncbi:hypothetical protein [Clostridium manihotivorum]|uniref:Uncharacterized protein n=1 Tax=Clostridium manihotivorum TaxID=2320868 RepID=A0A410DQ04_9CLOT|nr:hypothetical protein [Clostridium manihotivorum]QAA31117.1 hypothetical protein C1I91_05250 [Clostridium manihotivorum]